jgi:hypothetical protein
MQESRPSASPRFWICLALTIPAPLAAVMMVATYGVDLPLWDGWSQVPLMDKLFGDEPIPFAELWEPYFDHRIFFPRLIFLALAAASRWDVRWEMWFELIVWSLTFAVVARATSRDIASVGRSANWAIPVLSVFHFSLRQADNFLSGHALALVFVASLIVLGFVLLTRERLGTVELILAILTGVVATFSFSSGLIFWPLGGLILAARRASRRFMVAFGVVGALAWLVYFNGRELAPQTNPWLNVSYVKADPARSLSRPLECVEYALAFLGSPVGPHGAGARIYAVAGLAAVAALAWFLAGTARAGCPRQALLPAAIALFAGASALMAAIARSGPSGVDQAISSRYVTFAVLLYEGLVIGVFVAPPASARGKRAAALLIVVTTALAVHGSWAIHANVAMRYPLLVEARATLRSGSGVIRPNLFAWDADALNRCVDVLKKRRISMFRDAR